MLLSQSPPHSLGNLQYRKRSWSHSHISSRRGCLVARHSRHSCQEFG
jgi:hypothetical protein